MADFFDPSRQPGLYNGRSSRPCVVGDECDSTADRIAAGVPSWWIWTPSPRANECAHAPIAGRIRDRSEGCGAFDCHGWMLC